jgi:diaminohydroxyphosphoribosylaminopyrimidine deaminase/5-amino-6-(5-phosphoribosylamino)uracil reductase
MNGTPERTDGLTPEDLVHLERARAIAHRGWGMVHPNPMVGCVLVRDGEVVGEGYHEVFGGPHAEIAALDVARDRALGATAYVSLEPCDHQGKTPACSQALIQAGVSRVVFGAPDPSAKASGGALTLEGAGVDVVGPVWSVQEGLAENPAFFHSTASDLPYVALKLAMTLDGCISAGVGEATRITGVDAEREVHELRRGFEAVMVGGDTARTDDPRLTIRLARPGIRPLRRIVLDSYAGLPTDSALFRETGTPLHVFTRTDVREVDLERLEDAGAHVHPVPGGPGGLDLNSILGVCQDIGIRSILCEGGGRLATSLLREDLVRRLYLFISLSTLGEEGVRAFPENSAGFSWGAFQPTGSPRWVGRDALLTFDRGEGR